MAWRRDPTAAPRRPSPRGGDIELGIATILLAVVIVLTAIAVPSLGL